MEGQASVEATRAAIVFGLEESSAISFRLWHDLPITRNIAPCAARQIRMAASMPRLSRNPVNVLPRKKKMANGTTMIAQQIIITKCNGFDRPVRLSSVFRSIIRYPFFANQALDRRFHKFTNRYISFENIRLGACYLLHGQREIFFVSALELPVTGSPI